MRDLVEVRILGKGGAVSQPGALDVPFVFEAAAVRIVALAEPPGGIIAVLLEGMELSGEPAERTHHAGEVLGIGHQLFPSFGLGEELGEASGGELEADFGELAGVIFAEELEEIILGDPAFEDAVLFKAPLAIAAAGFPIGDVPLSDAEPNFVESVDDFLVGNVIAQHAADHVALEFRQAGDFAIAGPGF